MQSELPMWNKAAKLADELWPKHKRVQDTSKEAFYALDNLGARQFQVYGILKQNGAMCNRQIAEALEIPINQITPRTNELVEAGAVEQAYKEIDEITNRRVIYWRIK